MFGDSRYYGCTKLKTVKGIKFLGRRLYSKGTKVSMRSPHLSFKTQGNFPIKILPFWACFAIRFKTAIVLKQNTYKNPAKTDQLRDRGSKLMSNLSENLNLLSRSHSKHTCT